jgi:hypothetical protein
MKNTRKNIQYPTYNDPEFNIKITNHPDFINSHYRSKLSQGTSVKEKANDITNSIFEIASHQLFIKTFLSQYTPYNSMLLYHGLGTGKTCSAIGVSEDIRKYYKQFNIDNKIYIVASPNVQDNFRLQLFDEKKLMNINGDWDINGCVGKSIINEINPLHIKNYPRDKLIQHIKMIINKYYVFLGYIQLSKLINTLIEKDPINFTELQKMFNNNLCIIDEYHNLKTVLDSESTQTKIKMTEQVSNLVEHTNNMRLLLLSATPLYNNFKEIIWTINILRRNDKRSKIKTSEIFTQSGFTTDGRNKLLEYSRGYISFVKGDNPFIFPYKLYPPMYPKYFKQLISSEDFPNIQLNGKNINDLDNSDISPPIDSPIYDLSTDKTIQLKDVPEKNKITNMTILNHLITVVQLDPLQYQTYSYIIQNTIAMNPNFTEFTGFKYTDLQLPLQSLNMSYPFEVDSTPPPNTLTGTNGLLHVVSYVDNSQFKVTYEYKKKHDSFFKPGTFENPSMLKKYSTKIHEICCHVQNSVGIILIYSQFLDGGLIPMALALEEMGIHRHNGNNLFANSSVPHQGSYVMITGEPRLSPNNSQDVNNATNINNVNGDQIKVILITKAGSEGIDLKYIRQVHILEPWYNMNRIEQIIGRAVRNYSHKDLPFEQRNVEIFLYGTLCPIPENNIESLDIYLYRKAEKKAIQMGEVTRLLKESAVDCILNYDQQQFTHDNLKEVYNLGEIPQIFSDGTRIPNVKIGDLPFSANCDYMTTCEYKCIPEGDDDLIQKQKNNTRPMNEHVIQMNTDNVQTNIKELFKQSYFYTYTDLYEYLHKTKNYNNSQIYYALTNIINSKQTLVDMQNRPGTLVNIGRYYIFQPIELNDPNINIVDRIRKIPYKRHKLNINIHEQTDENNEIKTIQNTKKHNKLLNILKSNIHHHLTVIHNSFENMPNLKMDKHDADADYKYMGIATRVMYNVFRILNEPVTKDHCYKLVIRTYIDHLAHEDKLQLLEYVLSDQPNKDIATNNIKLYYIPFIVDYFRNELIITHNNYKFIILNKLIKDNLNWSPMLINEIEEEPGEYTLESPSFEVKHEIEEYICNKFTNNQSKSKYFGFIEYDNKKQSYYFKIKDTSDSRNKGRFCYQKIKKQVILNFTTILPNEMIEQLTINKTFTNSKEYLCILLMLLMRYLNLYYGPEYSKCI